MEIVLTKPESLIQVNYDGKTLFLRFQKNDEIKYKIKTFASAQWNIESFCWTVPKEKYNVLRKHLGDMILLKTKEEKENDIEKLKFQEETFQDVLTRIPKEIDTSYMKNELYNFQKLAVSWAITRKGQRTQVLGGILGDEPGLGKTIEALAISRFFQMNNVEGIGTIKRVLIVCPAPVKIQWAEEIERFTGEKCIVIQGKMNKDFKKAYMFRQNQYRRIREENIFYTVVNYELLRERERLGTKQIRVRGQMKNKIVKGEYIDLKEILANEYDMIILDEAHRIGNPETDVATAVREIQSPRIRLPMTGTPMEKSVEGIFQIADYIHPGILSDPNLDFWQRWNNFVDLFLIREINPHIRFGNPWQISGKGRNLGYLKNLLAPVMLRRKSEEVSDELPEMRIDLVISEWETMQKKLYDFLNEELKILSKKSENAETNEEVEQLEANRKAYRTYLKRVCDHPRLLQMTFAGRKLLSRFFKEQRIKKTPETYVFAEPERLVRLKEEVQNTVELPNGKWVIFSQFENMVTLLQESLEKLFEDMAGKNVSPYKIVTFTGKTPDGCHYKDKRKNEEPESIACNVCPFREKCQSRTKMKWYFQNDEQTRVIILSDAGNYGINLQTAANLFHYDLPDKVATFIQRNGRIRRLGSKHKQVSIKIGTTPDGIDYRMYQSLKKQEETIKKVIEKTEEEQKVLLEATTVFVDELSDVI